MALRKHGNVWCVYYKEGGRQVERSLGVSDRRTAQFMERQIMAKRRLERACKRLHIATETAPDADRIRLSAMADIASRHRKVSREAGIYWARFVSTCGFMYADQCTPRECQAWLEREFGDKSPKTYNNVKTALHGVFRACFGETGMESPFGSLINRLGDSEHHRTYTDAEVAAILAECSPFWRFMVTVSLGTGMSKESCLRFCPSWVVEVDGVKWVRFTRSKTARFGRQCQVPLRREVLDALPEVKGDVPYVTAFGGLSVHESECGFAKILERAGITANADGMADFHSFRATFISRCREAGIAEHAIRSMVGHVSSQTTDVYSHDMTSPLALLGM